MPAVRIEIPARGSYVGVVRLAVAALGRSTGANEEVVDDLKIAVSEACTNAVLSHERAGVDAPVSITWTGDGSEVTVEVGDRGAVYEPASPGTDDTQEVRMSMSLALLGSLVDRFDFRPRDGGGMVTRLGIDLRR